MRLLIHRQMRGFTLIELMVVVTIIGVLAMKGLPALSEYMQNTKLREAANTVVAATTFARSEAIKRNRTLVVESSGVALRIYEDTPAKSSVRNVQLQAGTQLVDPATKTVVTAIAKFSSSGNFFPFGSDSQVQVTGSTVVCGDSVRCPTVRIDSGGAISICREGACS